MQAIWKTLGNEAHHAEKTHSRGRDMGIEGDAKTLSNFDQSIEALGTSILIPSPSKRGLGLGMRNR